MYKALMKVLNTTGAATVLNVTPRRVRAMINNRQLPAQKIGRDYIIKESDLKLVEGRKPGRPSKARSAKTRERKSRHIANGL